MRESIHPQTSIGTVSLTVTNITRSLAYYQEIIGFNEVEQRNGSALLSVGGRTLLRLTEMPDARPVQRHTTGLYHFAILVPSRYHLARALYRLAETQTPVQGFSDHKVSEAIYLSDPDGHGIEIYRDRPREEWQWRGEQLQITTDPLDLEDVMSELREQPVEWIGLADGTTIGHIHLHVSHLAEADHFYQQVLGFDPIARYGPSASFVSAGGYHHHIGLNTWAGVGAPPAPGDAARLNWFEVVLPDEKALNRVTGRVQQANLPLQKTIDGLLVQDPSQNGVMLIVRNLS